ncbi:trypsin-like serine protease [Amycolatopsis sp. K13G38]|uniref:Trypsin-like serine protease n=1 Tax=Amycolatopsis acididurans TaxID=2724524 RepID=A0ABX1JDB1_9PSEU|nr:trypsin-like peptidase domain-containing protein [Amycolatopsis acididurans]NKQ57777.1 trypsin-like serine protease [Amycolatopsis acididurans]
MTNQTRRVLVAATAGAALAATAAFATGPAAAAPPAATPQTKAEAVLTPSLVYLETTWHGWVRDETGKLLPQPDGTTEITAQASCSGFVADSTGFVVTAGHCVDDQSGQGGKSALIQTLLAEWVQAGEISSSDASSLLTYGLTNWKVEGQVADSNPDRAVAVYQTSAASGVTVTTPMQASVVDYKALDNGDVALLKVQPSTPMPAIEVAANATQEDGTEVIAAGYPGTVSQVVDPKLQPSFKTGTISSKQTRNGVPFTETSAASTPGMSGGPVIGLDGRVLGTVSFGPTQETQAFNFMTDTGILRSMLVSHGVSTTLSAPDQAYRQGLNEYFAGKYHAAAADFDKVLAQEPNQAQAQAYRSKAIAAFGEEPAASNKGWLLWGGIGLGAAVLIAAAITIPLLLSRRRRNAAPGQPGTFPGTTPTGPVPQFGPPPAMPPVEPPVTTVPGPRESEHQATGDGHEPQVAVSHLGYCPNCGSPHPAEAHFCTECGQPFLTVTRTEEQQQQQQPPAKA